MRRAPRLVVSVALLLLLLAIAQAAASSNTVPSTGADLELKPIGIDAFVPPECKGMSLIYLGVLPAYGAWMTNYSNVLVIGSDYADNFSSYGSENCIMTGGGDDWVYNYHTSGTVVVLAGAGSDHVTGSSARDVIFGGVDRDFLDGGKGNDDLYGEDGNDQLTGGQGTDICIGGPGTDTFAQCETATQ